ncbi:nuclear transport factor 2 family protein [Kribbella italica]|uniref:Ketosteroid isomerase-like protein n=1 Tax=Kribbella italica TaxID=1540520 RepID=A0A7W9MYW5_9ACTN|nr:nuclear transport factor 2 family protein [Kribbella italica]MBB5841591.1 ketosteroid isomerase-like protein [Kribbella italica]
MSKNIPDLARAVLAAADAQDTDRLVAVCHDDVVFRFGSTEPVHGRTGIEAASRAYNQFVARVHHDVLDLWEPEQGVAVIVVEVDYLTQDGRELRLPCCNILRFRDDLVIDYRIYMDAGPVFNAS